MNNVGDKDDPENRQNWRAEVILAGSCASSALKIWIDSEDRFGTQSPKFQVQSSGGRIFQFAVYM